MYNIQIIILLLFFLTHEKNRPNNLHPSVIYKLLYIITKVQAVVFKKSTGFRPPLCLTEISLWAYKKFPFSCYPAQRSPTRATAYNISRLA